MAFHVPEKFRIRSGPMASDSAYGNCDAFLVNIRGRNYKVIASDGMGWEHVSVSLPNRCPNWEEMCAIKDIFWDDTDCVVQYHPPKAQFVNHMPFCLHLWRPTEQTLPTPPLECV